MAKTVIIQDIQWADIAKPVEENCLDWIFNELSPIFIQLTNTSFQVLCVKPKTTFIKGKVIPVEWIHSSYLESWLLKRIGNDTCLNVCSGESMVGNVRLDIREDSARTEPGDLFDLHYPEGSFDWVYCDPPFNFYVTGDNRFRWQLDLFKICKKGLITRRPKVSLRIPGNPRHEYFIAEDHRLNLTLIRIDYKDKTQTRIQEV